jgi:hypothetical protein
MGRDLPQFTIEVDTTSEVMRVDGVLVVGPIALSEDECLKRWRKVEFVSRVMAEGKDCTAALLEYNAAVKSCFRSMRQVVDDSSLVAGKSDREMEGLLWVAAEADSASRIVRAIAVEGGTARVLVDGASRSVAIIPRSASADLEIDTRGARIGSRLLPFAASVVRKVERARTRPFLLAMTTGGGLVECSGKEPVEEALQQVAEFGETGAVAPGPLTEECLR